MKTLKNAKQKNVLVNCDYYTIDEINEYLDQHVFFRFNKNLKFHMIILHLIHLKVGQLDCF